MAVDTLTPTDAKKRARGPQNAPTEYRHLTFPMTNAGPGMVACCVLPFINSAIVRIQLEGQAHDAVQRVRLLANCMSLLDVASYTDEGGEVQHAGEVLNRQAEFEGFKPRGDVVPVWWATRPEEAVHAGDGHQWPYTMVEVTLNESARWGATVRVIYKVNR
jgi:hypothetical protein